MKTIEPFGKNILAEDYNVPKKVGILIVENDHKNYKFAKIASPGPTSLNKDDIVMLCNYGGIQIEFNEKKYLLLKEEDILARIQE